MNWDRIYSEMVFSPYKENLADTMKLRDALTTLHAFLEGQTKGYDVQDALALLEARYGASVTSACNAIRKALLLEEEDAREQICIEAIQKIERTVSQNSGDLRR